YFDPEKPLRWLASVGARHGFEVVPLTPAFRAASVRLDRPLWFGTLGHYGHWNSGGHAVAAQALEEYFTRTQPGLDCDASSPTADPIRHGVRGHEPVD